MGYQHDISSVDGAVEEQWGRICEKMKSEIGDAAFKSWLKPMSIKDIVDGSLKISVPTRFMRDWVMTHYAERLQSLWNRENTGIKSLDISVQEERKSPTAALASKGGPFAAPLSQPRPQSSSRGSKSGMPELRSAATGRDSLSDERAELCAPLDTRYTFDNFVVGKPNEFAYAAAKRIAEAEVVQFNPLFLYGGVGLGKTHLMHAIAWQIRSANPNRSVVYMSAEKFMYRFIRALREKNTVDFKEQFRSVDVLMIDDVQFISGKESTQEEFFHTFNALVDQGRQIVISADKSPSDLEGMEERLKSRLNCGLVADIHATTYELRLGILQAKSEQMNLIMPQKVTEFLAHKITSNVRELEGALNRVVAHSQLVGRDITLESTQEVLHDLLRANDRRVTIEEIQKRVAEHFNIRISDMHSARRARSVARPRQVAMYLAKQLTSRSLPEIGRKFGGRDHTTVMHAVKKVDELRNAEQSFAEDVELLKRMLES
ncbi:MAG: chromosomal replication initiator protein DnaA [Alphaproteobacteria bacterium]|nr:chromosomal replication initiator protein DnaA [Rhodospirillales bacterium]MCW9046348.1 chromosomal replication initiator protein DnaA [Alphaproteobacteria bacterium]